jgi:hypothetical protein
LDEDSQPRYNAYRTPNYKSLAEDRFVGKDRETILRPLMYLKQDGDWDGHTMTYDTASHTSHQYKPRSKEDKLTTVENHQ